MLEKLKLGPIDRVPGAAWFWLALVFGAAFVLAIQQKESGRFFYKTIGLDQEIAKGKSVGEYGYRINIPKRFRNNATVERGRVFESKQELQLRAPAIRHVTDKGYGRFRIKGRQIYFSATDNSNPRTNGKPYELRAPRNVKPSTLWLNLTACMLCTAMFLRKAAPVSIRKPPRALEAVLVFGVCFGTMLWALANFAEFSDGWLEIKGAPFSDSMGWLELAESLADGRGFNGAFDSHRGGYPILLGSVFALLGGASVALAKIFNVVMLSLAASYLYFLARSAFGRVLAVLLLVTLLIEERFEVLVQYTLTEPTGFALGAIGLYLFYRAALTKKPSAFALAGIFLALSNITRPFTLLALPIFGLLLLIVAVVKRWGLKPFAIRGALFVGGAFLVFGPWMLRQKIAWGVTTLDLNSAVMLYGAAAPAPEGEDRFLDSRHYLEAEAAGIDRDDRAANYHYFMNRFKEEVARDPGDYFSYIGKCYLRFFEAPGFRDGHMRAELGTAFFLALALVAVRLRFAPILLLAGLWPQIADGLAALPAIVVISVSAVLALAGHGPRGRFATALLACTLGAAGVLNAMVGNFALNRGLVFIEWIVFLLVAAGFAGAARLTLRALKRPEPILGEPAPDPAPTRILPPAILAVFFAGLAIVILRNATAGEIDNSGWQLTEAAAAQLAEDAEASYTAVVELGEYRWFIPANTDLGHWSRFFEVMPYDRTVVVARNGYDTEDGAENNVYLSVPADITGLPGDQRYAIAGRKSIDDDAPLGNARVVIEVLALAPFDPETATVDPEAGLRFEFP